MPVSSHSRQADSTQNTVANYQLFLPHDYSSTEADYPMILFLHGMNRLGSDIERLEGVSL